MKSLTFNGIKKTWLYLLQGRSKPPFASVQRNLLRFPGMPGAYLQSSDVQPLAINQPIGFKVEDDEHALQLKDELAEWLVTDEPVELQFDDEPGRTYFAIVQNTLDDFEKMVTLRQGTIQFLCLDPYGYGPERTATFPSDNVSLTNNGTAEANPIFEMEVLEPVTFAMIQNQIDEYMMIGRPYDESQEPVQRFDSVFVDNGSTLTGWSVLPGGTSIDGGIVGGSMGVHGGYAFYAESFGSNPNGWVGPAIKKSLTRPIQDFRMTMDLELLNRQGNVGKVVVALLDANDNVVASVQMLDATNSAWRNRAVIRVGNTSNGVDILSHAPDKGGWNDFRGVLRIERIGNQFFAYVAKVLNDGRHTGRMNRQYVDTLGQFQSPVTQVRVYIAKSKHYEPFPMYFHGGNVWEINDLSQNQVPIIADAGDIITFDHKDEEIYINGEPRKDLKDFGADYFKLGKGKNQLIVAPSESFDTRVRYRERFR